MSGVSVPVPRSLPPPFVIVIPIPKLSASPSLSVIPMPGPGSFPLCRFLHGFCRKHQCLFREDKN